MKKGYTIFAYGRDCFIETNAQKRTAALARDFIEKIQKALGRPVDYSAGDIEYVKNNMLPAAAELKTITGGKLAGLKYIEITGENFSFGTDACNDPFGYCSPDQPAVRASRVLCGKRLAAWKL